MTASIHALKLDLSVLDHDDRARYSASS